jgi:hypothetical protein
MVLYYNCTTDGTSSAELVTYTGTITLTDSTENCTGSTPTISYEILDGLVWFFSEIPLLPPSPDLLAAKNLNREAIAEQFSRGLAPRKPKKAAFTARPALNRRLLHCNPRRWSRSDLKGGDAR